jgi:D-arabinose 5-phosphate isomerase GutQ
MAGIHGPVQNSEVYVLNAKSNVSRPPTPSSPECEPRAMSPVSDMDDMPITPPDVRDECSGQDECLSTAVHVLQTEATALSCLSRLYETDPVARGGFTQAAASITQSILKKGKLVISGVGKSGKIGEKLVATMNSLGILTSYLHPSEALHGDLGLVRPEDTILLITFSGKTPELLQLIPHFDQSIPLICLTAHTHPSTCAISNMRPDTILLPAPIHESEVLSFGVSAPTTSTTIAIALGDALAVSVSRKVHSSPKEVFLKNHPGGAIGQAAKPAKVSDIAVSISAMPSVTKSALGMAPNGVHIMMAAVQSPLGWVRHDIEGVAPPRRIKRMQAEDMDYVATHISGLIVSRQEWVILPATMDVKQAASWISEMRRSVPNGEIIYGDDAILGASVDGEIVGLVEISTLLENK